MSAEQMRDAIRDSRLSYADVAALLGVGIETLRSWTKPAANRPAPPPMLRYVQFLGETGAGAVVKESTPDSALDRLASGTYMEPPSKRAQIALSDTLIDLAKARKRDIGEAYNLARRFVARSSPTAIARLLQLSHPPVIPLAYEFSADGPTVAVLQGWNAPEIYVRVIRDVVVPGRFHMESPPLTYRFAPAALMDVADRETACSALAASVKYGLPHQIEAAKGDVADIAREAYDALDAVYRPLIYNVLVAHVLVERARILDGVQP